ncbi:hypothetical protein [Gordonia sp. (in: high G+C Gram-positive bacteria)]|uniref:hypothetical protein n=1 Tax=unclassified Gordonia (in: high G+C Gram-positive bacteria) TaxID=2657482 RepID=UPI002618D823|nr:hypothetical protein [Gordonia sp. (in: high G+C Gram-positive bacteria)]
MSDGGSAPETGDDGIATAAPGETVEAKKTAVAEEAPHKWRDRWRRVSHIYRTRVRTTTVLLVAVFIGGMILYLFSASHYGTIPQPHQPRPAATTPAPTTEPSRSVEPSSTPPSTSSSEPSESPSTGGPETSTSSGNWRDLIPGVRPTTPSSSAPPTSSSPAPRAGATETLPSG